MLALECFLDGGEQVGVTLVFEVVYVVDILKVRGIGSGSTEISCGFDRATNVPLWQPEVRRDVTEQIVVGELLAVLLPDRQSRLVLRERTVDRLDAVGLEVDVGFPPVSYTHL
ncbi:hypothetical protein [Halobiforma nitratireducens]|uniref:Uncharacterized protein n=1 Tax=Halobiforma nitratireducens JCM 10879 TaxID=1227454 RepID=M0MA58_9EURY|nr:hypothetical protein [Halobiforma nitratireducens]EMA41290.1 hypothetical protein C446_06120 [Halobiforma nitratireducens JCM 10879]